MTKRTFLLLAVLMGWFCHDGQAQTVTIAPGPPQPWIAQSSAGGICTISGKLAGVGSFSWSCAPVHPAR